MIVTRSIERVFGNNHAVDGVDLHVRAGEIYGFLGPNGAGKSTVVRMLTTLLLPTAGTATVAGFDVVHDAGEVRLRIGVALQEAALDVKQSGREMLTMQARLYGLSSRDGKRRTSELAELVDIGDALDDRVATYSGGMKRRLDLALALVHNPQVLFLDEPTTGLDPVSRQRVWVEVRRLNDELGMTIFLTTQYMEEADALADRVGIIDNGRLVLEGAPSDLKRAIGTDLVIVTVDGLVDAACTTLLAQSLVTDVQVRGHELLVSVTDGAAALSPIAVALAAGHEHYQVASLELRTPTLDDVFLAATGSRIQGVVPTGTPVERS